VHCHVDKGGRASANDRRCLQGRDLEGSPGHSGEHTALGLGQVKLPKPNLQQWAPKEEEVVWDQELAPKYEEGWFEASFPDVLEVQKADPDATWTWNEGAEEWVLDEPWWNGEMEDRMAEWHKPKEDWA
jgi:hypothetical protein